MHENDNRDKLEKALTGVTIYDNGFKISGPIDNKLRIQAIAVYDNLQFGTPLANGLETIREILLANRR